MDEKERVPKLIGKQEVTVSRFMFDDGSYRIKVSGPKIRHATPENTMEFLLNGVAFVSRVVAKFTEDRTGLKTKENVYEYLDRCFNDEGLNGDFKIVWPKNDSDDHFELPPTKV